MDRLDENPELILEPERRVTRSLDHQICSVTLRPISNHFANGYNVAVSATFGVERLRLLIDDEEISFRFKIYKAEIVMDRAECRADTQFAYDKAALADRQLNEAETTVHLNGGVGGVKHGQKLKSFYQFSKTDEALTIESCGSPRVPLNGQLLDEFEGWRIKPQLGVNSGVLGRVRVREDWITLEEPEHHAGPVRLYNKMKAYLTGDGQDAVTKQKKFSALLARLVADALQDVVEVRDATLAMDTVIVRPEDEVALRVEGVPAPLLELEGAAVEQYLVKNEVPLYVNLDAQEADINASNNEVINKILERYFAQLGDLNEASRHFGARRLFDTIMFAIKPSNFKYLTVNRPLPYKDQHNIGIVMRKFVFQSFLMNLSVNIREFKREYSQEYRWMDHQDKGYSRYDIRIGEFLSAKFSDEVYTDYFIENQNMLADRVSELQGPRPSGP